jgi:hypothetical protein
VANNMRARSTGVYHGRRSKAADERFTSQGLLTPARRDEIANEMIGSFLTNVDRLRVEAEKLQATPVFMTQTAFAWNANPATPVRGLTDTITIYGAEVNYADVSALHQELNRRLIAHCRDAQLRCFDLAQDVAFEPGDYYDYLHNTPQGTAKIGRYLADRLPAVLPARARP